MPHDVIVVGAGGMGSAAAYHLARRGARTVLLERFGVPHAQGSSHGITRIIRLAYFEHPSYVPLLARAYELWEALERDAGEPLLHITGSVDAGPPDSRTVLGSLHSCQLHGLAHDVLTSAQLSARFPGYALPPDLVAVWQPRGGFLAPERCIEAHVAAAARHGTQVHMHEAVLAWERTAHGVAVTTSRARYEATQLVLATGSWTPALVPALRALLTPERQVLAWFAIDQPSHFAPDRFPVFNLDLDGEHWYGFPQFGTPGFKVGCYHHRREVVDPDTLDRDAVTPDDLTLLRQVVRRCFPAVRDTVLATRTCLFTNTPDEHFILDRLPGAAPVVIAHACSGHGFKFASVVGEIVADLVLDGATSHDIARHRFDRFTAPAVPAGAPFPASPTSP